MGCSGGIRSEFSAVYLTQQDRKHEVWWRRERVALTFDAALCSLADRLQC